MNIYLGKSTWFLYFQTALQRSGVVGDLHGKVLKELMIITRRLKWSYKDIERILVTNEQEYHLAVITEEITDLLSAKYRKGAAEHGGNLMDNSTAALVDFAIDEAIDQIAYLLTLRAKMRIDSQRELSHDHKEGPHSHSG